MNINNIRNDIEKHLGIEHKFIYKGLRGQDDIFFGMIFRVYPRVFTIITNDGLLKSFSYSDYAINLLKIC